MVRAFAGDSTMTSRRRRAPPVVVVSVTCLLVVVALVLVLPASPARVRRAARHRPAHAGVPVGAARRSGRRARRHEDPPGPPQSRPRRALHRLLPTRVRHSRRAQGYTWPADPPPAPTLRTGTTSAAGRRRG